MHESEGDEGDDGEEGEHGERAHQTQFFADDGEDEVGVRLGQRSPLLATRAEAEPPPAAGAERELTLGHLPALAESIGGGVEPGGEAAHAIGRGQGEQDDARQPHRAEGHEEAQRRTGGEEHAARDDAKDEGVADVTLEEHEHQDHARDRQHRHEQMRPAVEHRLLAREDVGTPQDESDLGEFRRLQSEGADDVDPVLLARDLDADDEHGDEKHERDDERGPREAAPDIHREPRADDHEHDADGGEEQLALREGVRRSVQLDREHRGGAQHHEQAQAEQGERGTHEQVVQPHGVVEQ